MTTAYDKIKAGLKDALAHGEGNQDTVANTTGTITIAQGEEPLKELERLQRDDEETNFIKHNRT